MLIRRRVGWAMFGLVVLFTPLYGCAARVTPIPPAKVDVPLAAKAGKETAVFAGGCFWGTQSVFERVKGVLIRLRDTRADPRRRRLTIR